LLAIHEQGTVRGFNLLVGGGLGMTHGKDDTFARLAEPLAFVDVDQAIEAVRIVTAIFRDHGNRADRRHARLKYLIAEWGMERFRNEFRRRATWQLDPPLDTSPPACHDHLGRHPQGDGRWFYGIFIENGRIADRPERRIMSALRTIIRRHRPGVILTPQQNILLTDLAEPDLDQIEQTLSDHGVALATDLPAVRRYSMACPALPTCGLALAEAERFMPSVVDRFEAELDRLGLRDVPIALRMTGCPNGCSRPYTADIAFVGRRPDVYHVYVGGGLSGSRLADLFAADVPTDELVEVLRPLLTAWARNRRDAEGLGDFYQRLIERSGPRLILSGNEEPTAPTLQLEVLP
jgi:sulfite reductase beta subunit-like hemoprotein